MTGRIVVAVLALSSCGGDSRLLTLAPPDLAGAAKGADLAAAADADLATPSSSDMAGAPAADLSGADLAGAPADDLASSCGGQAQPCCSGNVCATGMCMTNAAGSRCIVASGCGGFAYTCCDAAGNPGATSIYGYCVPQYSCQAGTCK